MSSRRGFVKGASLLGLLGSWKNVLAVANSQINKSTQTDWAAVRSQFPITLWDKIHLNSGSAGVMPIPVRDHLIALIKYLNTKAPYAVWGEWQDIKKDNLLRLSQMSGCNAHELQIVRNTTEALNMIISGLQLRAGDEVIIAAHDYPFARNAWMNRAERDGIILKEVKIDLPMSDEEISSVYQSNISERTKIIHVTHMTHREGHIMPIKALTALAHQQGVEILVDGAHVIGQIGIDLGDLNCDYFASSLHKWLNAPLGTGMLFVKQEHIDQLYNHPSSNLNAKASIDKFEHLGTRPWYNEIGISAALDFHDMIGQEVKTNRLQELKEYWMTKVSDVSGVHFHTWIERTHSVAVSTFSIDGLTGGHIKKILDQDYNIHAKTVRGRWGSGIRVSVNIFTSFQDLDKLVLAIRSMSKKIDD